jgi:N6-L-threonylcarbamoyladenine synthase
MISLQSAKVISYMADIPLITVSHIESHLYAAFLMERKPAFPFLGLLVSGGNTSLFYVEGFGQISLIGRTADDAVGEAFDKVSKFLGLGYPGGPVIDRMARSAVKREELFPKRVMMKKDKYQFSYSGLKTAVVNYIRHNPEAPKEEIVWAFQESAVEILMKRVSDAVEEFGVREVVVAGGVAANSRLRERLGDMEKYGRCRVHLPSPILCTDNAAMVAGLGYHYFKNGEFAAFDVETYAKDSELRLKRDLV